MASEPANFATFFFMWAEERRWDVPDIHWRAVDWLENRGKLAVLRCFRGFGKSTLLAVYNAWRFYQDPAYRILHQGDQDKTAYKTSRDTKSVLQRHPLTREDFRAIRGESSFWWVPGAVDERNPSMQAAGITSTITSSRCDEAQNDDVEVPRNIQNPEAREKMRYRLGEQTHCMVPGARQLFIGTPHTHDSLYDEMESMGADCLTIPMFANEHRIEEATATQYTLDFVPEMVLCGVGKFTKALKVGKDYTVNGGTVTLHKAPGGLVDFYAGCAWAERFTLEEMETRRKKCRTINEWDSQYQLHSKPISETRLNPDKMVPYDVEPTRRMANGEMILMLGNVRLVGVKARWDCSLGKINSDASAVAVVFTDDAGRLYFHRAFALTGELEEFAPDGKTLTGGQIKQLIDLLTPIQVPSITIETNGPGGFVPAIARKHLKRHGIAVLEDFSSENKQKRILDAFEAPLSSGFLWAHTSVLDGPLYDQMMQFNPLAKNQTDDYIDAGAGAISETPVRIGKQVGKSTGDRVEDWRPGTGVHEVTLEV
jgi:hypothetical protein